MSAPFPSFRSPLSAVIAALLLGGCAYHSEYHAAGVGPRHSIKDDPEPSAAKAAPVMRPAVQKAVARQVAEVMPPVSKPLARTAAPALPEPRAPQSASVRFDAPAAPAPAAPVTVPPPPRSVAAEPAQPPVTVAMPSPAKPAEPPAVSVPPSVPGVRATTELRRAAPAAVAPVTPPAPAASAPVAVAAAAPSETKPATTAIVIQPKPNAGAAQALPEAKVAALSDEQRVRDTIARAQDYLMTKRIINARSLLQDAARDDNPLVLTALAETYDPLHLRDKFPALARAAEPARALDIYRRASERGSQMAAQKLKSLAEFLSANPGFLKR